MLLINHRINTLEQLRDVPVENGAEIDVRYHNNNLILHHDPLEHHTKRPLELLSFLAEWKSDGPLILNIKTEGIEGECIDMMKNHNIKNWFFLDLSMPYFIKYSNLAFHSPTQYFDPNNLAVRYSEFETSHYALSFKKKATWLWVDCFTKMPLTKDLYEQFKNSGFKICIVSPELQGHDPIRIKDFKKSLNEIGASIDAVCTKHPKLWTTKEASF